MQKKSWWKWTVAAAFVALAAMCTMDASAMRHNGIAKGMKAHPVDYVVASPRAMLARPWIPAATVVAATDSVIPPMTAAAYNFPRPSGNVLLPYGLPLNVRLSCDSEGVWYRGTAGWLGTFLIVDASRVSSANVSRASVTDATWVPIGRDGAADRRRGPSIGSARNIGVRFLAPAPGEYVVRARVFTYAMPINAMVVTPTPETTLASRVGDASGNVRPGISTPLPQHPPIRPPAGSFVDFSTTYIKVRVLGRTTASTPPEPRAGLTGVDMPRELFLDVGF